MHGPLAFLKFVARASLNAFSGGVGGDFVVEVLPDLARDVWRWWGQGQHAARLRDEVQSLAALPDSDVRLLASQAVAAEAVDLPPARQALLEAFLAAVPGAIRQSQRRPDDPAGRTLGSQLPLRRAEDLLPLLPSRLPRFQPGQRAPGFSDWELEELLGVGAFGEVWKARHPHLPPVALKFCLDPSAARSLHNEAALLGLVTRQGKHPGLVALLDTSLDSDPPCLKYEYVAGGDLGSLLRRKEPLTSQRIIKLMRDLADAVGFMHRLDPPLVHRDLKPSNILMQAEPGGEVRPRVIDFGIGAACVRSEATQAQRLVTSLRGACTPLYASPQQARGETPQPADDVWSLGVIWYQLLSRQAASGLTADWRDTLTERCVGADVLDLLGACLSSRAERRPADAAVLAEQLDRLTTNRASRAALPPPAAQRLVSSIGMEMVLVGPGRCRLGLRDVEIKQPFYVGVHSVTQEQYRKVMGVNPSWFSATGRGKDQVQGLDTGLFPVESVSWEDAVAFCAKLSERPEEKRAGRVYRLLAEIEWEYACSPGGEADTVERLQRTRTVGGGSANAFGVVASKGNVWEWCAERFTALPGMSSARAKSDSNCRVLRGRSWSSFGARHGGSSRRPGAPSLRSNGVGFRIALTAQETV